MRTPWSRNIPSVPAAATAAVQADGACRCHLADGRRTSAYPRRPATGATRASPAPLAAALAILLIAQAPAEHAGSIVQCTQADGRITLSDTACPPDTVAREYRGEATGGRSTGKAAEDPWSVMAQVRRIEKREAAARKAATAQARRDRKTDDTQAAAPGATHKLSYREAYRKALEATGYHEDSELSQAQRERLAEELAKYGHTLREPAKKSKTRKSKGKTKGAGEAATAAPDQSGGAAAVDPRNGSLNHNPRP